MTFPFGRPPFLPSRPLLHASSNQIGGTFIEQEKNQPDNLSNTTKFKYRCPGCDARTCSLPCYKRHQQWVQCDGKRDPTKFVKKSDLVTPAGIDHDFNFLTGIERGVEKAERNVEKTAASTVSDPRQGAHSRSATDYQLAATGVSVIRAPKGLSRQKENKTHCTK
jgi:hypothetical protein